MPRGLLLAAAACLLGCGAMRAAQARDALARGDEEAALGVWERRLADAPHDAEAQAHRVEVLNLMAEQHTAAARRHREAGALAAALDAVAVAVNVSVRAGRPLEPVLAEQRAVGAAVRAALAERLELGQPLAARQVLMPLEDGLHRAGLDDVAAALKAELATVGARRCAVLGGVGRGPHLSDFVARYCRLLGAVPPTVQPAPERRAALELELPAGLSEAARAKLEDAAQAAFGRSAWADPRAKGAVQARLTGTLASRIEDTPIELTWSWTTTEPYSTTETQTESYTESYTTYQSYTYSCGTTQYPMTCSGSRPVQQTRPATRQVSKSVTKYRTVPHSMQYQAVERVAAHRASFEAAVALPATPKAVAVAWTDASDKKDYQSDASAPAAGLKPHRADVGTAAQWEDRQARRLFDELARTLSATWTAAFCRPGEQPPEEAARCLAAGAGEQPDAEASLGRFLGEGGDIVRAVEESPR